MKNRILGMAVLGLLLASCQKQYLRGYYDRDSFFQACGWKKEVDMKYRARPEWMDSIRTLNVRPDVRIYLGTYCPDSKRWVPRFFALQDSLPVGNVEIISLDTTKIDERGMAPRDTVKKIPTFIFRVGGEERARIVEKPRGRIEKAVFKALKKCE